MNYLKALRINQWYKNLVIFLPIIFAGNLSDVQSLLVIIIGFFSLCLVSSAGYIMNDLIDKNKDKHHPEKRKRPIASGKISVYGAFLFMFLCLTAGLLIAYKSSILFFYAASSLFILTMLYSLYLKKEPFADILVIAVNFVIRAVVGALIINVRISPWLILCTFFLSLFLSLGKRNADLQILKEKAVLHRETFRYYDKRLMDALMIVSTVALIMAYSLYSFLSIYNLLILSLPFALYVIFRYLHLVHTGNIVARHPEKFISDIKLSLGALFWIITVLLIIYRTTIFL